MLKELTVAGFVAETSSDSPAPGGGSVSALCAEFKQQKTFRNGCKPNSKEQKI